MKRFIVAVSFAALAVPAFAAGASGSPYYQYQVDETLPVLSKRADRAARTVGAPYEQLLIDRALPDTDAPHSASSGDTHLDRGTTTGGSAASPWANDYRFIAPAQ